MKTLLIVRHAKSGWKQKNIPDHDRPLKDSGRRDARRLGLQILGRDMVPQLCISSTAKRARVTAELVAEACGYTGEIRLEHDLYAAGPAEYIRALQCVDECCRRVMMIGHNPGLEALLQVLTGETARLTPAALACVELPIATWAEIRESVDGRLVCCWSPKQAQGTAAGTR